MLFKTKPLIYLQLLDKSLRYMAVHPKDHSILEKDEIVFDTNVLEEGKLLNTSLLETRLDALVREKKWKNAKAYVLLMEDFVTVREETVPVQLTKEEIKDYLTLHMNRSIRMPFESPIFDFEILEKGETEQKIMLIAYPRQYVDQYQELLRSVSLKPEVADVSSLSLYRVAEEQGELPTDKEAHTMVLQWNPYSTNVMVFHQGVPTFNRYTTSLRLSDSWGLHADGHWQWKQSEEDLAMALEDQLDALERFLDFYRYSVLDGEMSVSEIILTGYYPQLNELKEQLVGRIDIPIQILTVPENVGPAFASLYGLSLKDKGGRHE